MDREQIESALKASRADYTEIRIETAGPPGGLSWPPLETADVTLDQGHCALPGRNGGWGIATFNDLGNLAHRVDQAYQSARGAGEPVKLAETHPVQDEYRVALVTDFREVPLAQKKRSLSGITTSCCRVTGSLTQAIYSDTFSTVTYANSEGTYIVEERPMAGASGRHGPRGDNVQRVADGLSVPTGYDEIQDLGDLAREVAQRATDLLSAETVVGGVYPVICNPKLAGVFVHEARPPVRGGFRLFQPPGPGNDGAGAAFWARHPDHRGRRHAARPAGHASPMTTRARPPSARNWYARACWSGGCTRARRRGKMGEQVTGNARATGYRSAHRADDEYLHRAAQYHL